MAAAINSTSILLARAPYASWQSVTHPLAKSRDVCHTNNMKNNKAMNLSKLAAHGNALDLLVADVQGEIKFTKLPTRKPRKADLNADRVGGASTRWHNSTGGNGRLKAGQLRADEIALKSALRR